MHFAYDIVSIVGKLSVMLLAAGAALLLGQALWVAFIVQGSKLVQKRQVLSLRDVVKALGEDGVWLAYLAKHPTACMFAVVAGALTFRAGFVHPGWIGLATIASFFAFGPVWRHLRRKTAALVTAGFIAMPKRT